MPHISFYRIGSIVHESTDGDVMISDPSIKSDVILKANLIEEALLDSSKAMLLAQRLMEFFTKARELRWLRVADELLEIKKTDQNFINRMKPYLTEKSLSNLRKLEKDVYFWKKSAENDRNEQRTQ